MNGYWSYKEGANEVAPEMAHNDFLAWEPGASRVLYYLGSQMLGYIKEVKSPKEALENLEKIFTGSTTTRKL